MKHFLKHYFIGMFAILSSVMILICYEWVITDHNVTAFWAAKFIPVVYSIGIVILCVYVAFKILYKKDVNK